MMEVSCGTRGIAKDAQGERAQPREAGIEAIGVARLARLYVAKGRARARQAADAVHEPKQLQPRQRPQQRAIVSRDGNTRLRFTA